MSGATTERLRSASGASCRPRLRIHTSQSLSYYRLPLVFSPLWGQVRPRDQLCDHNLSGPRGLRGLITVSDVGGHTPVTECKALSRGWTCSTGVVSPLSVLSNPFSAESPSVDSEGGLDCQMTQNQGEVQDISVRWSSRWLAGDTTADHNGQKRWRNSSTVLDASAASDPSHPRPILLVTDPSTLYTTGKPICFLDT